MTNQSLKNKKILISAGASGIGWATTKICLSRGAIVFICDINKKYLAKTKKHPLFNKKLFIYECDASNEDQVLKFFKIIKKKTKKVDALINNVGVAGPTGSIEKLKSKDWENTLHVDVNSHFYFTKQAIPLIKKSKNGSIINISSTAGILGFPLRSPYAASKWAIIGITKTLAMELGKFNIRVNAVCPGTIKGDRMKRVIKDKAKFTKVSPKVIEKDFISMSSMKQWILEEDIGKMCSFLISDDSMRVSGQVISVDGHTERND
jgi:NAD(P)-dependent dehydrogenase (short-subunit alcohol dehydrogenase family)